MVTKKDPIPVILDEKVLKIKIKDPTFFLNNVK